MDFDFLLINTKAELTALSSKFPDQKKYEADKKTLESAVTVINVLTHSAIKTSKELRRVRHEWAKANLKEGKLKARIKELETINERLKNKL